MNGISSPATGSPAPTRVRYGVLAFAGVLSMITYLDRACIGQVSPYMQKDFGLSQTQWGWVMGAFILAYSLFEIPSGWLGDVYGPRRTLLRIVLWWSFFTVLLGLVFPTPATPLLSMFILIGVNFLFGVGEAGAYPNIGRAFHNWFPVSERGFAQGTLWMAGRFAGGMTPLVVLLLMYKTPGPDGGQVVHWRHIFWIFGSVGVVWCGAFWIWFRDRPDQHPGVNDAEKAHILSMPAQFAPTFTTPTMSRSSGRTMPNVAPATGESGVVGETSSGTMSRSTEQTMPKEAPPTGESGVVGGTSSGLVNSADPLWLPPEEEIDIEPPTAPMEVSHANIPWRRLFTNGTLWHLSIMYFLMSYGWYFILYKLPDSLMVHYGIKDLTFWERSLLLGAPLLTGSLACLLGGLLTDLFIRHTGDRKWGRRLFGMIGHVFCALCYLAALLIWRGGLSPWLFVASITLVSLFNDLSMGATWAACLDIGRHYSGIVAGVMNSIGNLGGFTAVVCTGYYLQTWNTDLGYQVALVTYGLAYLLSAILWSMFDATKPVIEDGH